jgi:hypothetical protein
MRLAGDPDELHRKLALFEGSVGMRQTGKRGQDARHGQTHDGYGQDRKAAEAKSDKLQSGPFPAIADRRPHRFNAKTILSSLRYET